MFQFFPLFLATGHPVFYLLSREEPEDEDR